MGYGSKPGSLVSDLCDAVALHRESARSLVAGLPAGWITFRTFVVRENHMDLRRIPNEDPWLLYEVRGDLTCGNLSIGTEGVLAPFELEGDPDQPIVLNLHHANYLDSSGIGWLLSVNSALREKNLPLVLYSAPPIIERVASMMRLGEVIPILPNLSEVRKHLSSANS
jgi:anti-anti-sigma factor